MLYSNDMTLNLMRLKRCKKIYSFVFYIYLLGGILLIVYSIVNSVIFAWEWFYAITTTARSPSGLVIGVIIDAIIVAPPAFILAYHGSVKQHDIYAIFALVLISLNLVLMIILKNKKFFDPMPFAFYVVLLYSVVCIGVSLLNIWANIVYHKLENSYGFPHFNERFSEYEEEKNQRKIMDKYEMEMRRRMKTATDTMSGVDSPIEILEDNDLSHKPDIMDSL
ncbi:MAG: hypothetical protein IKL31_04935 [Ruminococcus sp.]|nr:hypothetical protein [Ruminococcus sp.]